MSEVIIIGGGVIGLGIAWRLAQRGADVTVFESQACGAGASGAAAGMLGATSELHFGEEARLRLELASLRAYPAFAEELSEGTGIDLDYRDEGTLAVALDRDDGEALDRLFRFQTEMGLRVERVSAAEARELEPGLTPSVAGGVFCAEDHQIDPPRLIAALQQAATDAGVKIRERTRVSDLIINDGVCTGVFTARGTDHYADLVVVCAGAWSRRIDGLPKAQRPPVRPVRGQMISLTSEEPICRHVIRAPDAYLCPKSDGRLLVGATMEEVGFNVSLTAGGMLDLLRGAWEALPGVYDLTFDATWSGLRPMSYDNAPLLGPTEVEGLWVATGHGRNGILLAPITASAMAASIDTGKIDETIKAFAPSRT